MSQQSNNELWSLSCEWRFRDRLLEARVQIRPKSFNSSATPENSQLVYISSVENFNLVMFQLALDPTCAYAINTAEVK